MLQEVDFSNTTNYTSYRVTFNNVKTNSIGTNGVRLAEVQLMGTLAQIAPGIFAQPAPAAQTLFVGASFTYSLIGNGPTPISYQWFQGLGLINGATNSSYSASNITTGASGTYTCVLSNAFGTTTSSPVTLNVILPVGAYANTIVADHPIAYYRLDEGPDDGAGDNGTNMIDYVGSHDGVYTNVVLAQPGYSIYDSDTSVAFGTQNTNPSFGGYITGGINFAAATNHDAAFSVEAWVNGSVQANNFQPVGAAGIVALGYGGGGEQFALDCGATSNSFRFFFRNAGGGSTTANATTFSADGSWHHLVGVLDEPNKKEYLYVDGRAVATVTLPTNGLGVVADNAPTNRFTIGWRNTATTNAFTPAAQFQGDVDEVSIYNYALSSNQVQAHYFAAGIAPRITVQPTNLTVPEGTSATFTSGAFGSPTLTNQWMVSTDGGSTFSPTPGATNNTLTLNHVIAASVNGNFYEFTSTNGFGGTNSNPANLTVIAGPPSVQTDLQPSYAFYAGYPISLSAVWGGTLPITYQWQQNGTNLSDGNGVSGSQSNVLTIANSTVNNSGNYQIFASNAQGGPVGSSIAAVTVLPVLGFNGLGSGWTSQGTANGTLYVASNVLQLTFSSGGEANSSFFGFPVYVGGFDASWLYQVVNPDANPADGVAFVVQNDPRGAAALGGAGGSMGVSGITPSVELEFNIYGGVASGVGIAVDTNGNIGPNVFPSPVLISSGDVIAVHLRYLNGTASLSLTDTNFGSTYSTAYSINVPAAAGGNTAFVGFTGGDGGSVADQQVSNFQFISLLDLFASASGNNLILSWPSGVGGYALQQSASLTSPSWTPVTNAVATVSGMNQVTVLQGNGQKFYRLALP